MDFIRVGQGKLRLVVAKLLWGGDAQLVQGWLQLLKIKMTITPLDWTVLLELSLDSRYKLWVEISYLFIY